MDKMTFRIDVVPVPKGRPRSTRSGVVFTPKRTRDNEKLIKALLRDQVQELPTDAAIKVSVFFYMPKPKRCVRKYPSIHPDIDNMAKTLLDASNDILWVDDRQIVDLFLVKRYVFDNDVPHTDIIVEKAK